MARIGITAQEVYRVANRLKKNGQTPTVDRIRESLGTGSRTTIHNHLKYWKNEQTDQTIAGLPMTLIESMREVYAGMRLNFEENQSQISERYEKDLTKLKSMNHELQQQLHTQATQIDAQNKELANAASQTKVLQKASLEQAHQIAGLEALQKPLEALNEHLTEGNAHQATEIDRQRREIKILAGEKNEAQTEKALYVERMNLLERDIKALKSSHQTAYNKLVAKSQAKENSALSDLSEQKEETQKARDRSVELKSLLSTKEAILKALEKTHALEVDRMTTALDKERAASKAVDQYLSQLEAEIDALKEQRDDTLKSSQACEN